MDNKITNVIILFVILTFSLGLYLLYNPGTFPQLSQFATNLKESSVPQTGQVATPEDPIDDSVQKCISRGGQVVGQGVCYFPDRKPSPPNDSSQSVKVQGKITEITGQKLTLDNRNTFLLTDNTEIYRSTQQDPTNASVQISNAEPLQQKTLILGQNVYIFADKDNNVVTIFILEALE